MAAADHDDIVCCAGLAHDPVIYGRRAALSRISRETEGGGGPIDFTSGIM
jgi:hypothetical protein